MRGKSLLLQVLTAGVSLALYVAFASAQDKNFGSLSGMVGYPSEEIPAMRIYAYASDGMRYYLTQTKRKQARFTIANVPAGQYYIVAYPSESAGAPAQAGGWSRFVTCGMTVQCNDHRLLPVTLTAGKTVSDINVADWYAPIDAFPPEPTTLLGKNTLANECTNNANQLERDACNLRGYQAANARLEESYRRAISALDTVAMCKQRLVDDQRTWLGYRDEHCAAAEGAGYKGYTSACLRALTEQRLVYMQRQTPDKCAP